MDFCAPFPLFVISIPCYYSLQMKETGNHRTKLYFVNPSPLSFCLLSSLGYQTSEVNMDGLLEGARV